MKKRLPFCLLLAGFCIFSNPSLAQRRDAQREKTRPGRTPRGYTRSSAGGRPTVSIGQGPRQLIKINPLSLFALTTNVAYERVINDHLSGQLGFFYTFPVVKVSNTQFQGFGITPELRYYFLTDYVPRGLYVGPFLRYQRFTLTYDQPENNQYDGDAIFRAIGFGAVAGGQWIFGEHFSLDAFLGLTVNSFRVKSDVPGLSDRIRLPIPGAVSPRFGLTIGYAF